MNDKYESDLIWKKPGGRPHKHDNGVTKMITSLGGQEAVAAMFNVRQATVANWASQGRIPFHWRIFREDLIEQYPLIDAVVDRKPLDPRLKP